METVKISENFEVKLPDKIRKALNLQPGQKLRIITYQDRIELIPDIDIKKTQGMLKGINTDFERENDRV